MEWTLWWMAYWITCGQLFYQDVLRQPFQAMQRDLNIQKDRINNHERRLLGGGL